VRAEGGSPLPVHGGLQPQYPGQQAGQSVNARVEGFREKGRDAELVAGVSPALTEVMDTWWGNVA